MAERRVINGEPCERVESFAELHPAMVIYDIACNQCANEACRGMLVKLIETEEDDLPGMLSGYAWELQPPCYDPGEEHFSGVSPEMVAEGRIWRVVNDDWKALEDNTKISRGRHTAARKPERV